MGVVLAMGSCIGCKRMFSFNPIRVPSITIKGTRQPICAECVVRVNPMRAKNGLPLIVPSPDAYDACDENELGE
jgi:hypothetical protein